VCRHDAVSSRQAILATMGARRKSESGEIIHLGAFATNVKFCATGSASGFLPH
jgi:hypothetical protein